MVLLLLAFFLTNAMSYFLGENNKDTSITHAITHTKIITITNLTDTLGYVSDGESHENMEVLEHYDIKDLRYYIVKLNGVKTLALHAM
ncbi:hypothetical protein [Thalassotalea insulae]|nr:hypothetical protein [Thalassotalea insulae]